MENVVKIKGMFRVRIRDEDGSIAGDSGWFHNEVTNLGFNQYIVSSLGSIAGSKFLTHAGIGTGTVPGAAATALDGEVGTRQALTNATSNSSKTLNCLATFAAGWHDSGSAHDISNVGMWNTSSGGTLFAGNTFASSSCASNQAVNVTYNLVFATA